MPFLLSKSLSSSGNCPPCSCCISPEKSCRPFVPEDSVNRYCETTRACVRYVKSARVVGRRFFSVLHGTSITWTLSFSCWPGSSSPMPGQSAGVVSGFFRSPSLTCCGLGASLWSKSNSSSHGGRLSFSWMASQAERSQGSVLRLRITCGSTFQKLPRLPAGGKTAWTTCGSSVNCGPSTQKARVALNDFSDIFCAGELSITCWISSVYLPSSRPGRCEATNWISSLGCKTGGRVGALAIVGVSRA